MTPPGAGPRRRRARLALALLCLPLAFLTAPLARPVTPAVAAGATYYAAPTGSDSNDCLSAGTPCLTIGAAIAKTAAGDTVVVAGGTYHERLSIVHDLTLAGAGAGATVLDGTGTVTGTLLSIVPPAAATVSGLTIQHGHAGEGYGGGVTTGGTLTLSGDIVQDNSGGDAGGIFAYGGAVTVSGTVVGGNDGAVGGIAASDGALTVVSSTVGGNSGDSGGIGADNATLTLFASTVSGNSGGGIHNRGAATLLDSTIDGNIGSGLDNLTAAALYNSTVSGNSRAGILSEGGGSVALANTIVGGNIGPDCTGALTSRGYNLLGSAATCSGLAEGVNGDRVGVDPLLGPLQDNGGPTATRALLPGSPAIDGGNPGGCVDGQGRPFAADQRGAPQPDGVNGRCDIGAYEEQSPPPGVATPVPTAVPTVTPTATITASPRMTPTAVTATPHPRPTPGHHPAPPPLTLSLGNRVVTSGGTLSIRLRTDARARLRVVLQVVTTKVTMVGSGKGRHRISRRVVLYQATLSGTADARGGYSGRLHIGYKPAKPVRASLTATAQTARGRAARTATVTIDPPRPTRSGRR